ncbi:MAG: hypothetical protein NTY38_07845, partial [Acidobacteria bacterium]|nr:hypothetical protein [Acidobacteriota bacterium]
MDVILASETFRKTERLQAFLTYIVGETLAGRGGEIKEYTVAASVFRRGESYDPKSDALVRVEARRLRERLARYYSAEGAASPVVIGLPKGSYRVAFARKDAAPVRRFRLSLVTAVILAAATALLLLLPLSPARPSPPSFGTDTGARDLYWQGIYLRKQRSEANLKASVQLFEQVVARQPENP